jgi:hypothetical protein
MIHVSLPFSFSELAKICFLNRVCAVSGCEADSRTLLGCIVNMHIVLVRCLRLQNVIIVDSWYRLVTFSIVAIAMKACNIVFLYSVTMVDDLS